MGERIVDLWGAMFVGGSVTITDINSEEQKVETEISEGVRAAIEGQNELERRFTEIDQNSDSDDGSFGLDDAASLGVGFTPAGIAADVYTAIEGEDFFTGEEVNGLVRQCHSDDLPPGQNSNYC